METTVPKDSDDVQSGPGALRRGLHILSLLRRSDGAPLSPAQIASALSMPRPSAYRVLAILESESYVTRTADGKRFILAESDAGTPSEFAGRLREVMERVAARTGNPVFLVRREGPDLVCEHREIGTHRLQILSMRVGHRAPLGVGAAGIALLSRLPEAELSAVFRQNADAYASYRNLQVSTIRTLIDNCRARGYAVVGNYMLPGVLSVGICIQREGARPHTAMSVTAPHERLPLSRQREVAEFMRRELDMVIPI
jgi:DNA-binding IclR family transcriptional regulator